MINNQQSSHRTALRLYYNYLLGQVQKDEQFLFLKTLKSKQFVDSPKQVKGNVSVLKKLPLKKQYKSKFYKEKQKKEPINISTIEQNPQSQQQKQYQPNRSLTIEVNQKYSKQKNESNSQKKESSKLIIDFNPQNQRSNIFNNQMAELYLKKQPKSKYRKKNSRLPQLQTRQSTKLSSQSSNQYNQQKVQFQQQHDKVEELIISGRSKRANQKLDKVNCEQSWEYRLETVKIDDSILKLIAHNQRQGAYKK